MRSEKIEKEIQQENKVLKGLSWRQLISIGTGGILIAIISLTFGFNSVLIPVYILLGVGAWAFGWYKQNGLSVERIIIKIIQQKFYNNQTRPYKTKNKYISLLNKEYSRRKSIDLANKKISKKIKKNKKQKNITKLTAID